LGGLNPGQILFGAVVSIFATGMRGVGGIWLKQPESTRFILFL
jgi:hypothetical protein